MFVQNSRARPNIGGCEDYGIHEESEGEESEGEKKVSKVRIDSEDEDIGSITSPRNISISDEFPTGSFDSLNPFREDVKPEEEEDDIDKYFQAHLQTMKPVPVPVQQVPNQGRRLSLALAIGSIKKRLGNEPTTPLSDDEKPVSFSSNIKRLSSKVLSQDSSRFAVFIFK